MVNSIVSSPMLGRIAARRGAVHETTLTGFKWIINAGLALEGGGAGRFAFGYEEALGYSVGQTVRDKDGLSAAVVMADLAAEEASAGRSVLDRLHDLWDEVGLWVSAQHSIVRAGPEGQAALLAAVDRLGSGPPSSVQGIEVTGMTDYRLGEEERPIWLGKQDLIELSLGDSGRVLVRPSGTEPKLKIYVDLSRADRLRPRCRPPETSWPTRSHWRRQWGSGSRCDRLVSAVIAGDARGRDTASPAPWIATPSSRTAVTSG